MFSQLPTALLLLLLTTLSTANPVARPDPDPAPQFPPGAELQEDTGQVAINPSPADNTTVTHIPISATIFAGVPGPKSCRGGVMAKLDLAPPQGLGMRTAAQCYNLVTAAGCGNFIANKEDGCEARLFGEANCQMYMNTAVFTPEDRAVGGNWRSMSLQCGIPPIDPALLGPPPLADMVAGAKKTPKQKSS
jgi:hypothetical protein